MPVRASTRDPRSIVTPDAFEVAPDLLGLPLAPPGKRLAALLIDLAVIGFLTVVTSSFALVLGVVAAAFFIRAGFKATPDRRTVFSRAMRFSVGCLGLVIGLVTAIIWVAVLDFGDSDEPPVEVVGVGTTGERLSELFPSSLGNATAAVGAAVQIGAASTGDDAAAPMRTLADAAVEEGLTRSEIRSLLLDLVPEDAGWADSAEVVVDGALREAYGEAEAAPAEGSGEPVPAGGGEGQGPGTELPAEGVGTPSLDSARAAAASLLADTLDALTREVAELRGEVNALTRRLERTREALDEATSGGLFAWMRDFIDELGFGFGWASLYLTVMLSWWKGSSVGKKLMGIRVLRLDGEPITWWVAFERAGGYAAGFATGLLGFAQVYWDANRQAIHDRIVGTVVVLDGAEPVLNWEEAL